MKNINQSNKGVSLKFVMILTIIFAFILSSALISSLYFIANRYHNVEESLTDYIAWSDSATDVESASDYLTEQARSYAVIGEDVYLENYFQEATVTKRRENALAHIGEKLSDTEAYQHLSDAINESVLLMQKEYHSMRLVIAYKEADITKYPTVIQEYPLSEEEIALSVNDKKQLAIDLVYDASYDEAKTKIKTSVKNAIDELEKIMRASLDNSSKGLERSMIMQQVLIAVLIASFLVLTISIYIFLILPVRRFVKDLAFGRKLSEKGFREYRYLATTYNTIKGHSEEYEEKLIYQAEHDILTGLYNRTGYDRIYKELDVSAMAFKLVDIDDFKGINDRYGHEIGDKILVKISNALSSFNEGSDFVCRIGGDEFAILMPNVNEISIDKIIKKATELNNLLKSQNKDGLPPVTLSIGLAFGSIGETRDSLYRKADKALYETKKNGRGHLTVYSKSLK